MTSSAAAPAAEVQSSAPARPANGPAAQAFPLQDSSPGSNPNPNN
jgi:hypothetical protein